MIAEAYWEKALAERRNLRRLRGPDILWADLTGGPPEPVAGYYRKTLEKCELMIRKWPEDASNAPFAYHFAGTCYSLLGEADKAVQYYRKVCDSWPQYQYNWYLLDMIGSLAKQLVATGGLAGADGERIVRDAYGRLLRDYPRSAPAKSAEQ